VASRRRRGGGGGGERRRRRSGGRFGASSGRGAAPAREGARGRVVLVGERAEAQDAVEAGGGGGAACSGELRWPEWTEEGGGGLLCGEVDVAAWLI